MTYRAIQDQMLRSQYDWGDGKRLKNFEYVGLLASVRLTYLLSDRHECPGKPYGRQSSFTEWGLGRAMKRRNEGYEQIALKSS